MPDFEFNADFKLVAFNGGYLITATVKCECLDPECNGSKFVTVWRNTYQEASKLLWETIQHLEAVPDEKIKKEARVNL
jgi:hypothetical protein